MLAHAFPFYRSLWTSPYLDEINTHFLPITGRNAIDLWSDERIQAGDKWREEIKAALEKADFAVLLVSADFLASDYIQRNELPALLRAAQTSGLIVFWIPVSAAIVEGTEISEFQAAHTPKKPLNTLANAKRQEAWVHIVGKIMEKLMESGTDS